MKKLLTFLSAIGLTVTGASIVVSCTTKTDSHVFEFKDNGKIIDISFGKGTFLDPRTIQLTGGSNLDKLNEVGHLAVEGDSNWDVNFIYKEDSNGTEGTITLNKDVKIAKRDDHFAIEFVGNHGGNMLLDFDGSTVIPEERE